MRSDEVKQKLTKLYCQPEDYFEDLCQSLFIARKPHTLLKNVDECLAKAHIEQLTQLGFICNDGCEETGLTLVPVTAAQKIPDICPACDRQTGCGEMCQHCGVVKEKYLKHKKFDDQLASQIQSAESSQKQMDMRYAERSSKKKKLAASKRENAKTGKKKVDLASTVDENGADQRTLDRPAVTVINVGKSNLPIYATTVVVITAIVFGGYLITHEVNRRQISDENSMVVEASGAAQVVENTDVEDQTLVEQQDAFQVEAMRKHERRILSQRLEQLVEDDLPYSAAVLTDNQKNESDRLFGGQELIKHKGVTEDTGKQMLSMRMMVEELDSSVDKVEALLNQSTVQKHLEFHDEAVKSYEEATVLLMGIESADQQVLAELAFADYHMEHDDLAVAANRYQLAKKHADDLVEPNLRDLAFGFIALSEADRGLVKNAELTVEHIELEKTLTSVLQQVDMLIFQKKQPAELGLLVEESKSGSGDQVIDDLMKMTEHNQKLFQSTNEMLNR